MPISMLHPTRRSRMSLQSRNTPSKDAPPRPAADDPSSMPREWLIPPFKEEFLASNTKPLVKNEDAAKTSMLINREALSGLSSFSRASSPGVSGPLGSSSSRTNASPSASPKALPTGAQQPSVGMAVLARNEGEIPRQKSAIPATSRSPKARTPPTPTLSSPWSLGGNRR
jgi:hypothetical protein